MNAQEHEKVAPRHLKRDAYLYVRQSTLRQVFENSESTRRQYALRQRAVALGWPEDRIVVIDSDLGLSGASAVDREGFQKLVTEVAMGRAGIVLGLEVSRLARNSADWHRLLEMCALTGTLILDEDGVYDPCHFNDRLLLGLKGAMSEAELHVLQARLQGGMLNKARRGELVMKLPIGFAYDARKQVILDPDTQIQGSIRLFFETFRRTGSAWSTVKALRTQGILFPHRIHRGLRRGELEWFTLQSAQALHILHNPRYAGAFAYGKSRQRRKGDGKVLFERLPEQEWRVVLRDAHPGYIAWDEYEENKRRLRDNAQSQGRDRRKSPPREGPALLQGLILCGRCGRRMTVRYHTSAGRLSPDYYCARESVDYGLPTCQVLPGARLDKAIGTLLLETMTPVALEVAIAVQDELRSRAEQADALRRQSVERARYHADLARRRYMQVDPANRLVADALEADWNAALRAVEQAQQEYERCQKAEQLILDQQQRARVAALATDFPRLWRDEKTPDRERKRMVRLLIEDVTLTRDHEVRAQVRFRGGATHTLHLPLPPTIDQIRKTDAEVVAEIDRLLNEHTDKEIASLLNEAEFKSGANQRFTLKIVGRLRRDYRLKSRYDRLRERGLLTKAEMANALGLEPGTVAIWLRQGLLKGYPYNERNECLYEDPAGKAPAKYKRLTTKRAQLFNEASDRADEV